VGIAGRSCGAWLRAVVRSGGPVLLPCGGRRPGGAARFLGAGFAAGVARGGTWAGRATSSGAARFPVARLLARWPSPRLPSTAGSPARS